MVVMLFLILLAILVPGLFYAAGGMLLIGAYLTIRWLVRALLVAVALWVVVASILNPTEAPAIVVLMITAVWLAFWGVEGFRWARQRITAVAAARPTGTTSG